MYALKLELKLNHKERSLMAQHAGYARFVYNYGLALYNALDHKEYKGSSSKKIDAIKKVLTNVTKKRQQFQWTNKLSSRVYQNSFIALKRSFERYFKGLGKKPVFKKKKDSDSFTVDASSGKVAVIAGKIIKIPTLGRFRLKEAVPFNTASQTFTVSRTTDRWFVSFMVQAEKVPPTLHPSASVGIDLGVKTFATLSDGTKYDTPSSIKKAKTKLSKSQWRNRNKQKASANAKKHYRRLAKHHARIANIRRDVLQKTTTDISKTHAVIFIEDLNVAGMLANHKLAEAISLLGFYEFRRQLEYKQAMYGTTVHIVDCWYPSSKTCSCCGHVQPMPLKERVFNCQACGFISDRDMNASINLNQYGRFIPELTPVDKYQPSDLVEAGSKQQVNNYA